MQKLLVICGPTGTGKTDLGLKLAKKFGGEIVSADSRQVYIGMNIGTGKEVKIQNSKGKISIQKLKDKWVVKGVPIHLYDVIDPDERFSLAEYQQLALERIKDIQTRKKLPILVGGTGLYVQAVTEGLKIPKVAPDTKLRQQLEDTDINELLEELKKVDGKTFEKIDKNNKRRIVRALEVFRQTGELFSNLQEKYLKIDFDILKIGLTTERETLYEKVDKRIESWFEEGFVDEVKTLLKTYSPELPSMTSLGYRQVAMHLNKQISLNEAKQRMKFEHHGYIRRQLTWFKRDKTIYWYDITMENLNNEIEYLVKGFLAKKEA